MLFECSEILCFHGTAVMGDLSFSFTVRYEVRRREERKYIRSRKESRGEKGRVKRRGDMRREVGLG